MMKKPPILFIFLLLITIIYGESETSTNNQHHVAYVFLSFAIFIVYCTLLVVYVFRYRIFKKSVTTKTDSQGNLHIYNRIKPDHDRYFAINRCLRRLKMNIERLNE
jgi:hypothetical protein